MTERYTFTEAADAGLGAEEFEGPGRFTRPCERLDPAPVDTSHVEMGDASGMDLSGMFAAIEDGRRNDTDDEALDVRVRLAMLDRAADILHEVLDETPADDAHRPRLRDLAFAAKGLADTINRDRSGEKNGPGGAPTPSEASVSTPTKRKNLP